jgi:hypothetical protein
MPQHPVETKGDEKKRRAVAGAYLSDEIQPLSWGNVPLSLLLDLGEDPGLDERASGDHDAVDTRLGDGVRVGLVRKAVAVAEDWRDGDCGGGRSSSKWDEWTRQRRNKKE